MTYTDPANLDALLVSHMHADHFLDIVPMRYAFKYAISRERPLPVFLPPGGRERLARVVSAFGGMETFFRGVMHVREYDPAAGLRLPNARVAFAQTKHYIEAFAMRVDVEGAVLAFSSDTAPCASVVDLARGADVFLCEAGLGAQGRERGRRGHSSALEAGAMAHDADARHLVITHYCESARPQDLSRAASTRFSGKITVADDGMLIPLR